MPRGPQTEEALVKQIAALDARRKTLKKKLQVMRIRAAAKRRKAVFTSIRKNEKEVLEVLKAKAPDFFRKLVEGPASKAVAKKTVKRRVKHK
jgi:hypothetical protein